VFDRLDDELGLAWAHLCLRGVANMSGHLDLVVTESLLAAEHLTRAGRTRLAQQEIARVATAMARGNHPASLAMPTRCASSAITDRPADRCTGLSRPDRRTTS
jgi:hypothetical protein